MSASFKFAQNCGRSKNIFIGTYVGERGVDMEEILRKF
jgi:hypothetical protein